jgi:hypothetical protein
MVSERIAVYNTDRTAAKLIRRGNVLRSRLDYARRGARTFGALQVG